MRAFWLILLVSYSLFLNAQRSGSCGEGVKWFYDSNTLTISGNGDMENFESQSHVPWKDYSYYIEKAIIEDGVKTIGDYTFFGCAQMKTVVIPSNINYIGKFAFMYCKSITSISIPDSLSVLGSYAFADCKNISSVILPDRISAIRTCTFLGCESLTELKLPDGLLEIDTGAFEKCYNLCNITLPNSVNIIEKDAFSGCKLNSLTIPSSVEVIGYDAFNTPHKTIWLTNTPPAGYIYAKGEINYVPNDKYKDIGHTKIYTYLSSLFEIDGVKYVPIKPSDRTCDAIDCIYSKEFNTVTIPSDVTYKDITFKVKNIMPYIAYNDTMIESASINIETKIPDKAFYGCTNLKDITLSDSISEIGELSFSGCHALKNINIPQNVKTIKGFAFQDCDSLQKIVIPQNVKTVERGVFYSCDNLKKVIIEDSDGEVNFYGGAFEGCPLDEVYIGSKITYDYYNNHSPFYRNTTLRAVTIADIETDILNEEFYGCSNLQNIIIGNEVSNIGDHAFSGCNSLTSFYFGANIKNIGQEAFTDCTNLKQITCLAQNPPICGTHALDDINKWDCVLFVPHGTLTKYQEADQWKDFFYIKEIEDTRISILAQDSISVYNHGNQVWINGIYEGTTITIFNTSGQIIESSKAKNGITIINIPQMSDIIIVKIGDKAIKLLIK